MIALSLNATSFVPGDEVVATVVVTQPEPQVKQYQAVATVDIGGQDYTAGQDFEVTFPAMLVGEVAVSIIYPAGGVAFTLVPDPAQPGVFRGIIPPLEG